MPEWSNDIRKRLEGLRLDPAREASIVEEISQHLDDRYDDLVARGASPKPRAGPRSKSSPAPRSPRR